MAHTSTTSSGVVSDSRLLIAAGSFLLGLFIVLAVGMSSPIEAHNAAHDTRHAAAFPCH